MKNVGRQITAPIRGMDFGAVVLRTVEGDGPYGGGGWMSQEHGASFPKLAMVFSFCKGYNRIIQKQ